MGQNAPITDLNSMKNRIRQVMESLHMTQMEFAEKTQIGAATLSNIFNDRTRPSLNVVELIKKKYSEHQYRLVAFRNRFHVCG